MATVLDTASAPLPGTAVTFTVTAGPATFPGGASTVRANTDEAGRATSPTLTAGGSAGPATITASTPGVSGTATFTATGKDTERARQRGSSFPVVLTISNTGPSTATRIGSGITLPAGSTITDGGGGVVTGGRRSVGFVAASLAPGRVGVVHGHGHGDEQGHLPDHRRRALDRHPGPPNYADNLRTARTVVD